MRTLPADTRALLALKYAEDLSVREIARVFNINQGTVKSRLFHAREKLREQIERLHERSGIESEVLP